MQSQPSEDGIDVRPRVPAFRHRICLLNQNAAKTMFLMSISAYFPEKNINTPSKLHTFSRALKLRQILRLVAGEYILWCVSS